MCLVSTFFYTTVKGRDLYIERDNEQGVERPCCDSCTLIVHNFQGSPLTPIINNYTFKSSGYYFCWKTCCVLL